MSKISINLLPHEVLLERLQSSKTILINRISIGVLIIVIIVTAIILILKISQNREVEQVNNQTKVAEDKVIAEKSKEETVYALKNRLNSIQSLFNSDKKVKDMFNLVVFLTPPKVILYDFAVDKNGTVVASFRSNSLSAISTLFDDLGNKEKNSNLISKIDLDGISLGKESTYRFSLRISSVK